MLMKWFGSCFLLLGLLVLPCPGQSGAGVVTGRVVLDHGEPAVGAIVLLAETKFGTSVDSLGWFVLTNIPTGAYHVNVRLLSYQQEYHPMVMVNDGDTTRVDMTLRESSIELSGVEVKASRRQMVDDVRPSVVGITPGEAKYLPGGAEDVLRSLQALPGVTSVSDYSSQLVVRGSGPDQNLILIDGFEVLNPYRLYGFVSMFNPETVSDISLQLGGFPAQYGDRLSAVLDVRNREGRTDAPFHGKINMSLTNANAIVEGRLPGDASFLLSLRRTYYDLILGPALKSAKIVQGDVALPNFRDLQAKIALPLDASNKVLIQAITSRDGVQFISGTERETPDSVSLGDESYNTLLGASWQFTPKPDIILQTQLSWYRNNGTGAFDGNFVDPSQNTGDLGRADTFGIRILKFGVDYNYVYSKSSFSQRLLVNAGKHSIELGAGFDALQTDYIRDFTLDPAFRSILLARGDVIPANITATVHYHRFNGFMQDRYALSQNLFIQPGVRFDAYPFLGKIALVSPRLSLSYRLNDLTTFRTALGMFTQSPGMEKENLRARVNFTTETFGELEPEKATHAIIGLDRMITPEWQLKVETYYKHFTDLVVPQKLAGVRWYTERIGANPFSPGGWTTPVRVAADSFTGTPVNEAIGRSYGFELLLQKIQSLAGDRFTGWIGYALSFADRERDGVTGPFRFDQRHAINAVGTFKLGESWDLGLNFTLRSGRPFARALGVRPRVISSHVNGDEIPEIQTDVAGKVILDVEYENDRYSGRLNLYHSLDARVTTYPGWWGLRWAFYLDITNLYNQKNEQQLQYYIDASGNLRERVINGLPFFPALGMSLAL